MRNDITGIILCGGKSSRMLTNKALLKPGEKTVIEMILNELAKIFDNIILSANNFEEYSFLNKPIVPDKHPGQGPLAGIYTAVDYSNTDKNFITTCDLPLISSDIIEYLLTYDLNNEIIVPSINGIPERLFGVYKKSVVKKIESIFRQSQINHKIKNSVYELHNVSDVMHIEISGSEIFREEMFLNMNTPEDYEHIRKYFL